MVIAPEKYPGKKYRSRYIYEHHLVWWQETGEVIDTSIDLIHHRDEDKHNNSFSNLVRKKRKDHTAEHAPSARMITLKCDWCGRNFPRELRHHKSREKNGYAHTFCCPSHQVSYQQSYQRFRGG